MRHRGLIARILRDQKFPAEDSFPRSRMLMNSIAAGFELSKRKDQEQEEPTRIVFVFTS